LSDLYDSQGNQCGGLHRVRLLLRRRSSRQGGKGAAIWTLRTGERRRRETGTAKQQNSISLAKRAEASYAEYRHRKQDARLITISLSGFTNGQALYKAYNSEFEPVSGGHPTTFSHLSSSPIANKPFAL